MGFFDFWHRQQLTVGKLTMDYVILTDEQSRNRIINQLKKQRAPSLNWSTALQCYLKIGQLEDPIVDVLAQKLVATAKEAGDLFQVGVLLPEDSVWAEAVRKKIIVAKPSLQWLVFFCSPRLANLALERPQLWTLLEILVAETILARKSGQLKTLPKPVRDPFYFRNPITTKDCRRYTWVLEKYQREDPELFELLVATIFQSAKKWRLDYPDFSFLEKYLRHTNHSLIQAYAQYLTGLYRQQDSALKHLLNDWQFCLQRIVTRDGVLDPIDTFYFNHASALGLPTYFLWWELGNKTKYLRCYHTSLRIIDELLTRDGLSQTPGVLSFVIDQLKTLDLLQDGVLELQAQLTKLKAILLQLKSLVTKLPRTLSPDFRQAWEIYLYLHLQDKPEQEEALKRAIAMAKKIADRQVLLSLNARPEEEN